MDDKNINSPYLKNRNFIKSEYDRHLHHNSIISSPKDYSNDNIFFPQDNKGSKNDNFFIHCANTRYKIN